MLLVQLYLYFSRHFDGAWFYKNEKEVAEGLKAGLEACEGKVKR